MRHTPGASALPAAATEARLLKDLFPHETTNLSEQHVTFSNVSSALSKHRWAHFACHAESDMSNPSSSHLLLHDHKLTVVDLARLQLDGAELAFLSACATARTGSHLADEAIHLAAACQLAGYRNVIATLWPVGDRPAVRIADATYTNLAIHGADAAAQALHDATRRRRNLDPDRPSTWAAHIHNGA
jgi:CHAT domain-containing protein